MAVPRNQVSVGNIKNPYEGLTRSLDNLSKTFLDEAARKQESERQAVLDAENRRRWDADKEYRSGRDAILDSRHADTVAEGKRRWEADEAQRDLVNSRYREEQAKKSRQEAAAAEVAANFNLGDARLEALKNNPTLMDKYETAAAQGRKNIAKDIYSRFLVDHTDDSAIPLFGKNKGITADMVPDNVIEVINQSGNKDLIDNYNKQVATYESDLLKEVRSNAPLYKGDLKSRIVRDVLKAGGTIRDATAVANSLSESVISKDTLSKQAAAREAIREKRAIADTDRAYKIYKLVQDSKNSNSSGGSFIPEGIHKGQNITDERAKTWIAQNIDSGIDDRDFFKMYNAAVDAGVDKATSLYALSDFREEDFLGDVSEAYGVREFIDHAKSLQELKKPDWTKSFDELKGMLTPRYTRSPDPIEANRLAFLGGISRLGERRPILPNRRELLTPTVNNTSTSTNITPSTATTTNRDTYKGIVDMPERYSAVTNDIPADIGKVLDTDWGGRLQPNNKREKLTKDYLDAKAKVLEATSGIKSTRDLGEEVPYVTDIIDKREAKVQEAIANLSKLRRELLDLAK